MMKKTEIIISDELHDLFGKIAEANPNDINELLKITSFDPEDLIEFISSQYPLNEETEKIIAELQRAKKKLKEKRSEFTETGSITHKDLLDAGVHFGHLTRKWNPAMAPYIFMEKNGIHIIDLYKTIANLNQAIKAMQSIVYSGRKIMFVATKKQAKEIVEEEAQRLNMPYVTERWQGGMLTNFATVRKSLKKLAGMEKLMKGEAYQNLAKRERLMISRAKDKLQRVLGGISDLNRLPAALFIVDIKREHIAVAEAAKLNIPVFGLVDTNSDPTTIDYPIPANDDAYKSIKLILTIVSKSMEECLADRKRQKQKEATDLEEAAKEYVHAASKESYEN